jgi:aspartyl-tRNA(Asn)/glutamyl-tRNA(Gln) amidotransferase subunit A
MSVAALGTDTLGSARIPASYCGIAAIKPTFGLISTRGVTPLCHRLDAVGLMAPTARDLVPLLAAVAGFDGACPDSRMAPEGTVRWTSNSDVGVLAGFWGIDVEPHVREIFDSAVAASRTLGRPVRAIPIGDYDPTRARRAGLLLGEADASVTYQDILSKQPESLSPEVLKLMTYGRDVAGEKIARASRLVDLSRHRLWTILREVEFIMTPTTPQSAIAHGGAVPANQGDLTALANIAGCPAVSIPVSMQDGRFAGIQLIGQPFAEERLLRIAVELQELLPHPPLPARQPAGGRRGEP